MPFTRTLTFASLRGSAFLFGPRMTGKTFLLRGLKSERYVDLLDPERELALARAPKTFWEEISALPPQSLVIVDEVQRVPALLDYVQKGMEELRLRFILSGSSARKLRRGGANLLGGRAADLRLHPLTAEEMGPTFNLSAALRFGTLPKTAELVLAGETEEARRFLRAYGTVYVKEEIQAEALTRNIGAFQRFLAVAAHSNGQVIEFANIARECAVPASTVKEYFSILEDTLVGEFLWPWDRSERKKARPKFYFFDCGVVRAIEQRLTDPPTPIEEGVLFETWFFRELVRLRDYEEKEHSFALWRDGPHEVDLVVTRGGAPLLAFECKRSMESLSAATLKAFRLQHPRTPLVVVTAKEAPPRKTESGVEILSWRDATERYRALR
jgi:predicted AAA+ superfamily ATPase